MPSRASALRVRLLEVFLLDLGDCMHKLRMLNGVELQGRPLKVDHWQLLSLNCVALSSYERPLAAEMCFA